MAVPRTTRVLRAWAEWDIALWSKILSMHGVGEGNNFIFRIAKWLL